MAITFGSFGDIIAAVQIACKLIEVLNAQRGAKREFRDVLVDLRLFHRYLDQLLSFWQTRQQDPLLENLYDILQPSVCDAKGEISSFLEHMVSQFGRSLLSPSRHSPKDVGKILQWHVLERDNVTRLQDKLRKSKEVILMVQVQANMIAEERNNSIVVERMDALMDAEIETVKKLEERLDSLEEKAEKQFEILGFISRSVGNINSTIGPIASLALDLPATLGKIQAELFSQRLMLRGLNPFAQNSAIVEDALGWTFPIPLELIASWNTVHSILMDRFANRPGYDLVKGRRYVIRDDVNGSEVRQNIPLSFALRPGQKINMCMVYFTGEKGTMMCPRCKKSTLCAHNSDFTCSDPKCAMEIQRIEEIFDNAMNDNLSVAKLDVAIAQPDFEDTLPSDLVPPSEIEDSPEVFKRVRFLTRWEFRNESRGSVVHSTGQYSWWAARGSEPLMMRQALFKVFDAKLDWNMFRADEKWDELLAVTLCFVGTSVQRSRPVIHIFSMDKRKRSEAWKHSAGIDWIKAHPTLTLLTTCNTIFHNEIKMLAERRSRSPQVE